jgi:hypothetical protein
MVGIVHERRKAQYPREPRRIDSVLHPTVKAACHQLHGTQTISLSWQGTIGLFDFAIVRRNTLEKVGKLGGQRRVYAGKPKRASSIWRRAAATSFADKTGSSAATDGN